MDASQVALLEMKIELLTRSKTYLRRDYAWSGICLAVNNATADMPASQEVLAKKAANQIKYYISRALGNSAYLNAWLEWEADHRTRKEVREMAANDKAQQQHAARMYATRIAWVDWMIDQYKAQLQEVA